MTDNPKIAKGVHDPWRMGTPDWQPPPTKNVGTKASKHPLDWDLQPDKKYIFRMDGAEGALIISGTDDPEKAAEIVMLAIKGIPDLSIALEIEGFNHGPAKDIKPKSFFFHCKDYSLTHASSNKTIFTVFVRAFLRTNRTPAGKKQLTKWGIKPLLAG